MAAKRTPTITIEGCPDNQLPSVTGRVVPLPPLIQKNGNLVQHNCWLLENAIAEAEARGDDYALAFFRQVDPKNFSQSDRDSAHEYLFGRVEPFIIHLS